MLCPSGLALLLLTSVTLAAPSAPITPHFAPIEAKILTAIAGLYRCVGVPDVLDAKAWGCPVVSVPQCGGSPLTKTCGPCQTPTNIGFACRGQATTNTTGQDGTPVTFNLPVDVTSVLGSHFMWHFADGSTRTAECAIPNGGPANELNELNTIAIIGNAGGWSGPSAGSASATALSIEGDLMLIQPDGSKVSAKGLRYEGPSLNYENGVMLLRARLENFTTAGETLTNQFLKNKVYPNHCAALFGSKVTHRVALLFDGGVSLDGVRPITPDRTDLFELLDSNGKHLPARVFLGLADLGTTPIPSTDCEKANWPTDIDNYLDICLTLDGTTPPPATIRLPCNATTQISKPAGAGMPCKPQSVAVTTAPY